MLQGYITVYTAWAGLGQFIDSGSCTARLEQEGPWTYPIVVPREAVTRGDNSSAIVGVDLREIAGEK
ncbi:hypothetical protein HPY27_16405 [Brevibacillus sp. HB1.1]|uniref:hypothetical protein n=1 Tax=Brevibacillus TaxID=55080 RepID=UPI00157610EF|nr:hypothetical protein [Brevibacillus sp. HB1.1]NTU31735.1 hypothetical protein [Brevibacillus sp. HB1.1]